MGKPFAIEIFYPDGDPENMRVVNKMGWTGKVFYIGRDYWTDAKAEYGNELKNPGIYVLAGREERFENNDDLQTIYIGHTGNLATRIEQHIQDQRRDFFQSVVCATGGDGFTTAHFQWMESHLINRAREIERCDLKAGAIPNKPQVSRPQEVAIGHFLEDALQIFQVVDITAFIAPKPVSPPSINGNGELGTAGVSKLRKRILDAFQREEKVKLLKRSLATFYDESKTIHVGVYISKFYKDTRMGYYQFYPHRRNAEFLQAGGKGYFLFCMAGQCQGISFPIRKFTEIKKNLGSHKKDGEINWWNMKVFKDNGKFQLKLKGGGTLDISEYLIDMK